MIQNTLTRNLRTLLRSKFAIISILFALVLFIYLALNLKAWHWYVNTEGPVVCKMSDEDFNSLIDMAERLKRVFAELHIKYWLVYGSIIGAIRYKAPIPWDTDIDLAVEWETVKVHSPAKLKEAFAKEGLSIDYRAWGGFFRVENERSRADLMVFTDYWGNGWMNRMGIESWVFFANYWKFHVFPATLVQDPLPEFKFGNTNMTGTHGGIEILKWHYPNDWDREVRPEGC